MYYAEIRAGKVAALLQTDTEMPYPHVEIDEYDTTLLFADYDEGEFTRAPAQTHKTSGITKPELTSMLTGPEQRLLDKARILLDVDMSWHPFNVSQDAEAIGFPGETYKDLLRSSFERYKDAPDFDVNHPDYISGWLLHAAVGFIDPARVPELMLGFPLR